MSKKTYNVVIKRYDSLEREVVAVETPDVVGAMQVAVFRWMGWHNGKNRLSDIQAIEVEDAKS